MLILVAAFLRIQRGHEFLIYHADEGVKGVIIIGILAGLMTFITQLMFLYRYIGKHYEEITNSDIEPWSKDKPFAKDLFGRYKADKKYMKEPSFIAFLFDEKVANQKATWSGFFLYSTAILALVLMFLNFGFIFDVLKGSFTSTSQKKFIYFLAGTVLLIGCQLFWRTSKKK